MAASARGVSKTRAVPNSSCRPSVTRNTPPSLPTSSPRTRARGSSASESRRAWLSALTMVTSATGVAFLSEPQGFVLLPGEVRRKVGEHPLEHLLDRARPRFDDAASHVLGELLAALFDLLEVVSVRHAGLLEP